MADVVFLGSNRCAYPCDFSIRHRTSMLKSMLDGDCGKIPRSGRRCAFVTIGPNRWPALGRGRGWGACIDQEPCQAWGPSDKTDERRRDKLGISCRVDQ